LQGRQCSDIRGDSWCMGGANLDCTPLPKFLALCRSLIKPQRTQAQIYLSA